MEQNFNDDTKTYDDSGTTTATETGAGENAADQNNAELQERMGGDNIPWYSPSEGKVVDINGEVIVDPETNKPFKSMDEFERWKATQNVNKSPATPEQKSPVTPMSKSFDSYMTPDGKLTPEQLIEISKGGLDYKYADDLVPKVTPLPNGQQPVQPVAPVDPVERVKAERIQLDSITIKPIQEIRDALIKQGGDINLVDQLLAPILQKQTAMVQSHYENEYQKAIEERLDSKYAPRLSQIDEKERNNASIANIEALARKYYPQGGKDALFALVNGYNETGADGKQTFVRGPSALVMDLLESIASDGKNHTTEKARNDSYAETFKKITADPAKARAFVDIAHFYWLGRKVQDAQGLSYQKGKAAAQQQDQLKQRTIKTKPASYAAPVTDEGDDKKMPSMLRMAMQAQR
jgi:hypothetical protein